MASSPLLQDLPVSEPSVDLKALEQKVMRAIELLGQARAARAEAERDVERLKAQMTDRDHRVAELEKEMVSLRRDRESAREHVEKIISQIDSLISAEAEA